MTPGLVVTPQGCRATTVDSRSVTIKCPFTLSNTGTDTLVIAVVAVDAAGNPLSFQSYQLLPGATPVQIGAPPAGGTWLVVAQTQAAINWDLDWLSAVAITGGFFAGWGVVSFVRFLINKGRRY